MTTYHLSRQQRIDVPPSRLLSLVQNFSQWPLWNPWLCLDASATVQYSGEDGSIGSRYDWDGEVTGAGNMTLRSASASQLRFDLEFLSPFRSRSEIVFDLQPHADSATEVVWHMHGNMPFLLAFMIPSIKRFVGMDFERGLRRLQALACEGKVPSHVDVQFPRDIAHCHWVAVERQCRFEELGESMREAFGTLISACESNEALRPDGAAFSLYHKMDLNRDHWHYSAAVPVAARPTVLPAGLTSGERPAQSVLQVTHTGAYEFLGNAWAAAYMTQRARKLKLHKKHPPMEIYIDAPDAKPRDQLITQVCLALR